MNKLDLVCELKITAGISQNEAALFVDMFFDQIARALEKGQRVELRSFCSFFVKEYKGYRARNPKTGEMVDVETRKRTSFKMAKKLKERINK